MAVVVVVGVVVVVVVTVVVAVVVAVGHEPMVSCVGPADGGLKRGIGPSAPVAVLMVLVGAKPPVSSAVPVPEPVSRLA